VRRTYRTFLIIAVLAVAAALTVAAAASRHASAPTTGTVTGTPTGDSLVLSVKTKKGKKIVTKHLRVPIAGIVAPAGASCFASQSVAQLRSLALGKRVTLTPEGAASYVSLPGGADLGTALVSAGAAEVSSTTTFSRIAQYAPLQEDAERNSTGMWGACAADLSTTITGPAKGSPGDYLTYTASVSNAGPLTAQGVNIELRPGSYAKTIYSASTTLGSCNSQGWVAYCKIDALGAGSSATLTLVIRATQAGALSARVTATLTGCTDAQCGNTPLQDPNQLNDRAAAFTIIPGGAYGQPGHECDPSYPTVCIPPSPPDLDCADFAPLRNFPVDYNVANPDDHHLDGDHNGIACQGEDY
jgi:endonuclease YncB( thermonuclease family)